MYHDNGVKVTWKRLNTEMSQKNGLIKLILCRLLSLKKITIILPLI